MLIDAPDPESIRRGSYQFVMGELHLAMNTLDCVAFATQHPDVSRLFAAIASDLPAPRVIPVLALPHRVQLALMLPKDYRLLHGTEAPAISGDRTLLANELVVEYTTRGLLVRTRDRERQWEIIEFFAEFFSLQFGDCFKPLPPLSHLPRVTLDRLVISRETWRFSPGELTFAVADDAASRFLEARRWAQEQRMPRFLFARTPGETKPYYVDLESPIFVELFAKAVRHAQKVEPDGQVIVSEMLPTPDASWLPDAQGNRYTSELRFVAVDLEV